MTMYYVSSLTKRLVTRNSGTPSRLLKIFNHTTNELELSLVDPNNTILNFPSGSYYFVGSFSKRNDVTTIFFSADFEIVGQVLKFNYDTNTYSFLDLIKGDNVQIAIEIGYKDEAGEHVILQDIAIASQRYYIDGMPTPKDVSQYYTKLQTEEAIDKATSGLASVEYVDDAISEATSGAVTQEYVDEQDTLLQEQITTLDENKQDEITEDAKLGYDLLSGTPSIPTKTSDLQNDSDFATSSYVQQETSGKADKTELEDYQIKITSSAKLGYDLLSGTPTIPLSTSQLTNDNGYATSGYVQQETSGKMDTPSGGTAGQVLTKTENGEEWADSQGGEDRDYVNYFKVKSYGGGSGTRTFRIDKINHDDTLNIQYSTDCGQTWTQYTWNGRTGGELNSYSTAGVWLKGTNDSFNINGTNRFQFILGSGTYKFNLLGNIMTLLDETGKMDIVPDNCFYMAFQRMHIII